jgi:hypothetical protein
MTGRCLQQFVNDMESCEEKYFLHVIQLACSAFHLEDLASAFELFARSKLPCPQLLIIKTEVLDSHFRSSPQIFTAGDCVAIAWNIPWNHIRSGDIQSAEEYLSW